MPLVPLLFLLAATQNVAANTPPAPPSTGGRHWGRLFISPMGEPFRADRGADPLAVWFAQADRNHDGYLTLDEMEADAERFFAVLDTNHDGEIDPDEIDHYESAIAPEISSAPHFDMSAGDGDRASGGHHRRGGGGMPRENETHQGAARFGLLDLPEPVSSADADFNRGVSLSEFRQAAGQRFLALDLAHKGKVSLATLETIRPPPGPTPTRPANSGSGDIDTESIP